ncbi:DUF6134 family protein [Terasakiella pusilla]|uniref:DUF6134 family protein n=2 Tax=Terasakiella pusilla TaxID=64973 RepID=UPI003AA824B8
MMKIASFLLGLMLISPPAGAVSDVGDLYGDQIAFDVLRKGDVVGEHVTTFQKKGEEMIVNSRMNIDIMALFFPLYAFEYRSKEIWKDDQLTALDVRVLDGSDKTAFTAKRENELLDVTAPDKPYQVAGQVFTTNHWNSAVVNDRRVLNTLTGNINIVTVEKKGRESVDVVGGVVEATRYDYTGDLKDTSVWYDDQGRWVKLRFKARDGSMIDYRCRTCLEKVN